MPREIDDFSVCDENWNRVGEVTKLRNQIENVRLWFHADQKPDLDVIREIDHVADAINVLQRQLIHLQIKLITAL